MNHAGLARIVVEDFLEQLASAKKPAFDGTERYIENVRDFLVRQSFQITQQNHFTKLLGYLFDVIENRLIDEAVEERSFRILLIGRQEQWSFRRRRLLHHLAAPRLLLALPKEC